MKNYYDFKEGVVKDDFGFMAPRLAIVLGYFGLFCEANQLPCKITSMFTDRVDIRKHTTHIEGRAFDASVRGWNYTNIQNCIDYMNHNVGALGAVSKSDGIKRVVVFHKGTAEHFHFQVSPL